MRFRRFRFRRHFQGLRRRKRGGILWLVIIILFALLFQILWALEDNLEPTLMRYATTEVKKIANDTILDAAREQIKMGEDLNQIIQVEKDREGRIRFIQIDRRIQTELHARTLKGLKPRMARLKDTPIQIPLGQALDSTLLASYGPKVPIEIWPKGVSQVNFRPEIQSAGVNNVMVTLMMEIRTEMGIVVPFRSEPIVVHTQVPLAQAVVVGDVPKFFYYNDMGGEVKKGDPKTDGKNGSGERETQPMPILPPIEAN